MADSWEEIDLNDFDCKLCGESGKFVELPCKHSFCEKCLAKWRKEAIRMPKIDGLRCPFCRAQVPRSKDAAWLID